ncbi:hypothetical protein PPYR_13447 [Photinus pyralis]|uniref:Uncharacterized protein n=1 Tax=Photinus pyralis TaxID=7054 RepID=A0A5N4A941_PHOPY|nr:methylglutaconyl-CoA hydratase, mitochondrial-like [Photinus pyralis]KAB0793827.1 hypothetical protein PPYR_13447 [Photinus pyralis]
MRALSFFPKTLNLNIIRRTFATPVQQVQQVQDVDLSHLCEKDTGISVLSLNCIQNRNTITSSLVDNLNRVFDTVGKLDTKVLIIKSNVPKIFCTGADLKERLKMSERDVASFVNYIRSTLHRLHLLPMPVIAALDGSALGGGLEMALACDIRVAASSIKLGLVETRLAIIPGAGGSVRLPRLINPALAKELIYTAKVFDGSEAKAMGVVNHVVEQNDDGNAAYLRSLGIAREILPNGPIALRMAKFAINKGVEVDINTALSFEEAAYSQVIPTRDRIEGLRAFVEKRRPSYTGE